MGSLNMIFLWSSLGLLAVTGLMVGYDYIRGWLHHCLVLLARIAHDDPPMLRRVCQGFRRNEVGRDLDRLGEPIAFDEFVEDVLVRYTITPK